MRGPPFCQEQRNLKRNFIPLLQFVQEKGKLENICHAFYFYKLQ